MWIKEEIWTEIWCFLCYLKLSGKIRWRWDDILDVACACVFFFCWKSCFLIILQLCLTRGYKKRKPLQHRAHLVDMLCSPWTFHLCIPFFPTISFYIHTPKLTFQGGAGFPPCTVCHTLSQVKEYPEFLKNTTCHKTNAFTSTKLTLLLLFCAWRQSLYRILNLILAN